MTTLVMKALTLSTKSDAADVAHKVELANGFFGRGFKVAFRIDAPSEAEGGAFFAELAKRLGAHAIENTHWTGSVYEVLTARPV